MEEYAPAMMPTISGTTNSRIAGPDMISIGTITIRVVTDVIRERPSV